MYAYVGAEGKARRRLNTQVTVAVEPPSPTDGSPTVDLAERHQRSQVWQEDDETRRDLHRTRTMPARRARSSTDVADGPNSECPRRRRSRPGSAAVDCEDPTDHRSVTLLPPLVPEADGVS